METTKKYENNYDYSLARIQIRMERNSNGLLKIVTEFYLPTGVFASLSMLSFFIDVEQVPGRMGMLVTIYLISINTYAALEGPRNRGFSNIEVTFKEILHSILAFLWLSHKARN